jgi:hydroxyacylglutathione hydrolase
MFFDKIITKGISHNSYMIGDSFEAAVIDPTRDIDIYLNKAASEGLRISLIFETHRNEDFLCGSLDLSEATGAKIYHADTQWKYEYGEGAAHGQTWFIGSLKLEAIHTPGHTPGSMSYLLSDSNGIPFAVFTGDSLLCGDIGRVDLLGEDELKVQASNLYESVFSKLLNLGDQVIVFPAHGPGSICGSSSSSRDITTIGLERLHNPFLHYPNKASFVDKVARMLERPPYFDLMAVKNLSGSHLKKNPVQPLTAEQFKDRIGADTLILDCRSPEAFASGHITGSLSIWLEGVSSFAGWFLPHNKTILLLADQSQTGDAQSYLRTLGYDHFGGYLAGGFPEWCEAGYEYSSIDTISFSNFSSNLSASEKMWILDVRSDQEIQDSGTIEGSHHIHVTQLPLCLDSVPTDIPVFIICESGRRSMTAASILIQNGPYKPVVVMGGISPQSR